MQTIFGIPISVLVLVIEILVLGVLIVGWAYGSRKRRNFKIHHRAIWLVVLLHILTVGFWMIPVAIDRLSISLSNPLLYWYQILHDIVGLLAIGLGALLVLVFLIKGGMPGKLVKRTKPFMLLTIGIWLLAFVLGLYWFFLGWAP